MESATPRQARLLDAIERAGNRLPDPVTLFVIAIAAVTVLSWALSGAGVRVTHPGTGAEVGIVNLLGADQVRRLFTDLTRVFADFPPLTLVLIMMLGVGVAERSGLIGAALGGLVRATPRPLLTGAIVFTGVMSSLAADAGYVVLVPMAAAIFAASGRHPLAGLAAALAGVTGGFSANLLVTPLDPLLSGLTQAAAQILDPAREVSAAANYYLMIALVPLFTVVGWWLTDRVVEPRLAAGTPWRRPGAGTETPQPAVHRGGLRLAALTAAVLIGIVAVLAWEPGRPFRDDAGTLEPLLRSLVAISFVTFLLCGLAYGIASSSIRSDRDAVRMMAGAMGDMGAYIVLAFFAAVFLALFTWSNIGIALSVTGAGWLRNIGLVGLPLLVGIALVAGGINVLVGSASAKWAILAPVFVPMLAQLGITPEWTQAAYRIGDASTNAITPLLPYFPLVLITARRYVPEAGIGSMVALMLPYSIVFTLSSLGLFAIWYLAELPLGPGQ